MSSFNKKNVLNTNPGTGTSRYRSSTAAGGGGRGGSKMEQPAPAMTVLSVDNDDENVSQRRITTGNNNNNNNRNSKYDKKNKHNKSNNYFGGNGSVNGILRSIIFFSVFYICYKSSIWHFESRDYEARVATLRRAKELWYRKRQYDAPHAGKNDKYGNQKNRNQNDNMDAKGSLPADVPMIDGESWTSHLQRQFAQDRRILLMPDYDNDNTNHMNYDDEETQRNNQEKIVRARTRIQATLKQWLEQELNDIRDNLHHGMRWIRPYLLPPHPDHPADDQWESEAIANPPKNKRRKKRHRNNDDDEGIDYHRFFKTDRIYSDDNSRMKWEEEYEAMERNAKINGPAFDYTDKSKYLYPPTIMVPPADGTYPPLKSLKTLMTEYPQDEDYPLDKLPIRETLIHFNYSDPVEREAAASFRDAELPFKLYDIPEIDAASVKWTDEYISRMYGSKHNNKKNFLEKLRNRRADAAYESGADDEEDGGRVVMAAGAAQESPNNYFAFFVAGSWNVETMGLPPTRNNNWSYEKWAKHAQYADAVTLSADQPHFYWQSGVDPQERYKDRSMWTFISKDLPSYSSVTENFFLFHPEKQKGIQCRFGERGVVAATHFDGGRNMVAMIHGAKRYILSPPNQCSKLGIFTSKRSPIYRHSLLNFGHIPYIYSDNETAIDGISREEIAWLERAASSQALETVLKKGEVLYIPSHWFHYIVSLQKSAQCNVRSGIEVDGNPAFGGRREVEECTD